LKKEPLIHVNIRWKALCYFSAFIASVFTVFIGGSFLIYGILKWTYGTFGHREPTSWVIPLTIFPTVGGLIWLTIRIFKKIPLTCPYCGGKAYLAEGEESKAFLCSSCNQEFSISEWQTRSILKKIGKAFLIAILGPIVIVMLVIMLGIGGPFIFRMFFGLYFVLGPLLQILVRVVPQPAKENQPTPWPQFFGFAYTYVVGVGALLAIFRFIIRLPMLFGQGNGDKESFVFLLFWDMLFGACGLVYAFVSFAQEGLWRYRQMLAVRDIPSATVGSAAVGLVELSGTAKSLENPNGAPDTGRTILSFFWHLLGTEPHYQGGVVLGSYHKDMRPFYLDDGTGRILIDPVHDGVELRRPFISALTTFFGKRSFEVLLTGHVGRPSWYEREYSLQEGDQVYVIGSAEMRENVRTDAVGPERLVVRPRGQARSVRDSLLQFLVPFGKKASRTSHDVFVVSDSGERKAKGLLRKNFLFSIIAPLALALISAALIVVAKGLR
jgi:hypothetical protein